MIEYVIVISAVLIFGLLHSGLSTLGVKGRIIDRWGKEGYARVFKTTSIITFAIAFLSMNFWNWLYFFTEPTLIQPVLLLVGVILGLIGVVLTSLASRVISVSTVADMRTDRKAELITDGIYSRVRHPLYLATLMVFAAFALIYPFSVVIVFSLCMMVYTLIGAYFEERKLVKHYGADYLEYRKKAGFIIPKL
ncbi:MAG: methyltransferase family protein [Promethearchaeota archaeon]